MMFHSPHIRMFFIFLVSCFYGAFVSADCTKPVPGTCGFYADCLEKRVSCGESGYALGYGEPYCKSFLEDVRFTERGVIWRDRVSSCLQRSLVQFTDPLRPKASCDTIREEAFHAHVACYTQSDNSICDLFDSFADIHAILSTVKLSDLLSKDGKQQVIDSAKTCIAQLATSAGRKPTVIEARKKAFWESVINNPLYNAEICE